MGLLQNKHFLKIKNTFSKKKKKKNYLFNQSSFLPYILLLSFLKAFTENLLQFGTFILTVPLLYVMDSTKF